MIILWLDMVEKGNEDDGLDLAGPEEVDVQRRGIHNIAYGVRLLGVQSRGSVLLFVFLEAVIDRVQVPDVIVSGRHAEPP